MSDLAASGRGFRERLRPWYASWLPLALGLTALVNIVLTFFLSTSARPIVFHEDGSLTHLAHTEQPTVDRRFSFYFELDDATDGGVLIVPEDSFVIPELADGFAGFEVREVDYEPLGSLPDALEDQAPLGVVATEEGDLTYSIVPGEDDVWWLAQTDEGFIVVPAGAAEVPVALP